ncbi:MAG TPA: cation transporter [Anaerolineales bacterium]|nr:cation transporter [Anaerolineales bacterium]
MLNYSFPSNTQKLYQIALWLAVFSILYNFIEGIVSTRLGAETETLSLFGFGVDSFIELISAIGVLQMVLRIQKQGEGARTRSEVLALQITGTAFYLLVIGLIVGVILQIWQGYRPETTIAGLIISLVSIMVMWLLLSAKLQVGKQLNSPAIIADANCTRACIYMSVVLLVASLLYQLTGIAYVDSLGALGIAWFCYKEGRESFEKAQGKSCSCEDSCNSH